MIVCKEACHRFHLYVSFGGFYQLLLKVIYVVQLIDAFQLLIPVFVDKPDSLVAGIVEMQSAYWFSIIVICKDGEIGLGIAISNTFC